MSPELMGIAGLVLTVLLALLATQRKGSENDGKHGARIQTHDLTLSSHDNRLNKLEDGHATFSAALVEIRNVPDQLRRVEDHVREDIRQLKMQQMVESTQRTHVSQND